MKWLKYIGLILFVVLLIGLAYGLYMYSSFSPDYNEEIKAPTLNNDTEVYYDEYGVPHIYASNIADAYHSLGYVHAKDRLWQMDLLRRIAPGRLSELFGEGTVENDKFFRTLGIGATSKEIASKFDENHNDQIKAIVNNYISGINQYITDEGASLEHRLLGINPDPYTIEDVYNVIGYMSFSFAVAHRTEPLVDLIKNTYGSAYLDALDLHYRKGTSIIKSEIGPSYAPLSLHVDKLLQDLPVPQLIGSNSWVIGPDKSKTKGVLFANDPHIGFSQPSVWYEAHIVTPEIEVYGNYIAGFPMPQVGHTRHHAIGLTMFENDDIDYYREKQNPNNDTQYWSKDKWKDYSISEEIIKVKDGKDLSIKIRSTEHGPIVSDVIPAIDHVDPVSMYWVYQKFENRLLEASYRIMFSNTIDGVREGAKLIHAPGLNVMYGDVEGNIAWWAAAKLPKRPDHVNSKFILDGASGLDDITGYYEFTDNPQAINPASGYVYSANNQSVSLGGIEHEGYYLPEDRARRIMHLIEAKDAWTVDDMKEMILDVTSFNAIENLKVFLEELSQEKKSEIEIAALSKLEKWNGAFQLNDIAPTIYTKLLYHTLHTMMQDELGEHFETFNGTHLMKRSLQPMIANDTTAWWDNLETEAVEDRGVIIAQAFKETIKELESQFGNDVEKWTWSKAHQVTHQHAFNANPSLAGYFNVGPFPVSGSTDVINNYQFKLSEDGTYEVLAGPSCRRIIDMTDLDNQSFSILPTGQSGNVLSEFYSDQAEMHAKGQFRRQLMNKEEIIKNAKYHTSFKAE